MGVTEDAPGGALAGAQVRAALAYAKMDDAGAAELLGVNKRTIARLKSDERPLAMNEARTLAQATGVPAEFFVDGWSVYDRLEPRVRRLERALERRLISIEEALVADRGDGQRLAALEDQIRLLKASQEASAAEVLRQIAELRPPSQPSRSRRPT